MLKGLDTNIKDVFDRCTFIQLSHFLHLYTSTTKPHHEKKMLQYCGSWKIQIQVSVGGQITCHCKSEEPS